ncbi:histidinol-phosphatase [Bacteroidota bacterium]
MPWTNYHSHNHYCDGKFPIEDQIRKGIEKKFTAIGITSHSPVYFYSPWALKTEETDNYFSEIELLREKYRDYIQVYKSLEVEYIPGMIGPGSPEIIDYNLDYVIGSVHFVKSFEDGLPWGIDGPYELFERGFYQIYQGNIQKVIEDFYCLTRQMVVEECPEVIGHIDKIKMHGGPFFCEDSSWYVNQVKETLDLVTEKEAILEVNTRGIYKGYTDEPYPSWRVLKEIHKRGIPIQLNSDSHHPNELDGAYETTAKRLLEIGFRTMRVLLNGQWEDVEFDAEGLQI